MNIQELGNFLQKKKWKDLKKSDWLVIGLLGVLLLVIAMPMESREKRESVPQIAGEQTVSSSTADRDERQKDTGGMSENVYAEYLEEKLEAVLSRMDGVGDVEVMVTVSDMGERVVEKDTNGTKTVTTEVDSAGGNRTVSENTAEGETVYVENGDEKYPYVQKEKMPTVEGVVVVAQGGGNSVVVSNISEAVEALLPVEAHRIKVVKMCSKEE